MRSIFQTGKSTSLASGQELSRSSVLTGRILILFTAVLLAVMPLTEHIWTFDGVFIGGQDFEFGLLSVATILCMVLVVSQHRRQGVNFLLTAWRWISPVFQKALSSALRISTGFRVEIQADDQLIGPISGRYNLPLQI
jgi:hypothetical protein